MHLEGRTRVHLGAATDWLPRWLAILFPFSIIGSVLGQSVLVPPPGFQGAPDTPLVGVPSGSGTPNTQVNGQFHGQPEQPNGQPTAEASGEGETAPSETAGSAAVKPVESLMQWGALHLRVHATYQFGYDTGVQTQPGQSADTFTHTFSPALLVQLGPHWSLNYTPSFRFFSQRDFHNTVDHSLSLSGGVRYGDWSFGLSQSFSRSDEPLVETGSQTAQESYSAGLSASYRFNDKLSFDTSAGLGMQFIEGGSKTVITNAPANLGQSLSDSRSYSAGEWANYQFDDRVSGAVGVTLGYSEQQGGFNVLNEQYLGRVSWTPGSKLTISVNGGIEDQQFLNTGAPDLVNPIFSASLGYRLFEPTTLSLSASRAVNASLFQNEISESTQIALGLQQRLLGKLQLSMGFTYGTVDYKDTKANLVTSRSDESQSYNLGLGLPFLTRGNIATFYQYTRNESSDGGFGYSSSQVGATVTWDF